VNARQWPAFRQGDVRLALLVLVAAATLHGAFVALTYTDPLFRAPDLDEAYNHLWARSLSEGQGDFRGPYFVAPLYPHALALLYRLCGPQPLVARSVQTALGALATLLVFGLGKRLFGHGAGLAAALLMVFFGPLVFYEGLLLVEVLFLVLVLGALAVLLLPRRYPLACGALAGALLGLAALGRATALLALPVAVAAIGWNRDHASGLHVRRQAWRAAVACVLACGAVLFPVALRNARLGGGFVLTSNFGVNLAAGNYPGATGRFHAPPGVRFFQEHYLPSAEPRATLPPGIAATALTVTGAAGTARAADSRAWTQLVRQWAGAHPLDCAALLWRKVWLLCQAHEEAHLESYSFQQARLPALRLFPVDFGWLWPLAALGGWRAWRARRSSTWVVAGFAVALLLPCVIFFVSARYRLAAAPMVALFAGHGLAWLARCVRVRAWRSVSIALVVVAALAVLVRAGGATTAEQRGWEDAQMAARLYALGDLSGAIALQEQAAALLPRSPEVQVDVARYWSERGTPADLERAERLLRDTARAAPDRALVPFVLGTILVRAGRAEEARAAWQQALVIDPAFEPARARLRGSLR
jgi:4-amino-4-deoxy-L-arabinose transferase-like glycosyltransferase